MTFLNSLSALKYYHSILNNLTINSVKKKKQSKSKSLRAYDPKLKN